MDLPSTKPYLLRALHEWCRDNGFTPFIAVEVDANTLVPREHVRDGKIVLNIGDEATNRLLMDNEKVSFVARFGGVARDVMVPIGRIAAIFARENGSGMNFEVDPTPAALAAPTPNTDDDSSESPTTPPGGGRPKLQRIK